LTTNARGVATTDAGKRMRDGVLASSSNNFKKKRQDNSRVDKYNRYRLLLLFEERASE